MTKLVGNLITITAAALLLTALAVPSVLAVEGQQTQAQPGSEIAKPDASGSTQDQPTTKSAGAAQASGQGMMSASGDSGMDMMNDSGGGMDMMDKSGDSGGGMMAKMGPGMMRMMMSHMMGGPGGMGRMMGSKKPGKGPGMMARMTNMLDQLKLSPEQWDMVRKLAKERLLKMVDLWAQQTKLRIELSSLRWDQKVDPNLIKDLFVKKAEAQAEMFLTSLDYLRSLESILTPEQAKKLKGFEKRQRRAQ